MSWMNINPSKKVEGHYDVDYTIDHTIGNAVVDEETARLLEAAKKAGASERMREVRALLECTW